MRKTKCRACQRQKQRCVPDGESCQYCIEKELRCRPGFHIDANRRKRYRPTMAGSAYFHIEDHRELKEVKRDMGGNKKRTEDRGVYDKMMADWSIEPEAEEILVGEFEDDSSKRRYALPDSVWSM